jgi:hypothetical protein
MISTISALSVNYPQGCKLSLGIKNTSGVSSTFKFIDTKTKEELYLDNLALSLSIGVKFNDNIVEENKVYLITMLEKEIQNYIQEVQDNTTDETIRLNFNAMLDSMKTNVPNISYFELYSVNIYDASRCQTIFWKRNSQDKNAYFIDEYLSIKSNVDESLSDIPSQTVVFKSAIDITALN